MLQILLSEMPCPALGSGLIETHVKSIQHIYCFKDLLLIYGNLDTEQRHSKIENKTKQLIIMIIKSFLQIGKIITQKAERCSDRDNLLQK